MPLTAPSISDFGFRISDFRPPARVPNGETWARSTEVPGIPIRSESACLASSREARGGTP